MSALDDRVSVLCEVAGRQYTHEGSVYVVDDAANMLVLRRAKETTHQKADYVFINQSTIKSVVVKQAATEAPRPVAQPLTEEVVAKRRDRAADHYQRVARRIGKHVSREEQELFNALYPSFPGSYWGDDGTIMLGGQTVDVPLMRPHRVENVRLPEDEKLRHLLESKFLPYLRLHLDKAWRKVTAGGSGGAASTDLEAAAAVGM